MPTDLQTTLPLPQEIFASMSSCATEPGSTFFNMPLRILKKIVRFSKIFFRNVYSTFFHQHYNIYVLPEMVAHLLSITEKPDSLLTARMKAYLQLHDLWQHAPTIQKNFFKEKLCGAFQSFSIGLKAQIIEEIADDSPIRKYPSISPHFDNNFMDNITDDSVKKAAQEILEECPQGQFEIFGAILCDRNKSLPKRIEALLSILEIDLNEEFQGADLSAEQIIEEKQKFCAIALGDEYLKQFAEIIISLNTSSSESQNPQQRYFILDTEIGKEVSSKVIRKASHKVYKEVITNSQVSANDKIEAFLQAMTFVSHTEEDDVCLLRDAIFQALKECCENPKIGQFIQEIEESFVKLGWEMDGIRDKPSGTLNAVFNRASLFYRACIIKDRESSSSEKVRAFTMAIQTPNGFFFAKEIIEKKQEIFDAFDDRRSDRQINAFLQKIRQILCEHENPLDFFRANIGEYEQKFPFRV